MAPTRRKSYVIVFLGALVLVGLDPTTAQTDEAAPIESLTPEQVIAGLTANLDRIRTYKATFVVSDPNGDNAREYTMGWEKVPGSGITDRYDKRFWVSTPEERSKAPDTNESFSIHAAFNGEKTFICETNTWGKKKSIDGYILPGLDSRVIGRGLTVTALSTNFMDIAPIQPVLANGTFVGEGTEMVNGHKCVAVYGEYGYAETPFDNWRVKHGPGTYVRLSIDPRSGYMPVRQEWYNVTEVVGQLRRKRFWTYTAHFKEFEGGIWFPVAGSYEWREGKQILKVKDCSLNIELPPEAFAITEWPPGTFVEDKVTNTSYRVPRSRSELW